MHPTPWSLSSSVAGRPGYQRSWSHRPPGGRVGAHERIRKVLGVCEPHSPKVLWGHARLFVNDPLEMLVGCLGGQPLWTVTNGYVPTVRHVGSHPADFEHIY